MSERWKFVGHYAHFVSFAVVGWIDVFTRAEYAEYLLKDLPPDARLRRVSRMPGLWPSRVEVILETARGGWKARHAAAC